MMRWLIACLIAWAIIASHISAAEMEAEVRIAVKPQVCFEPCDITAVITITGYEAEREVCLAIYDASMVSMVSADDPNRRSCWPWYGRKVTDVSIRNIPAGTYNVVASLTAAEGRRATQTLRVLGEQDARERE